MALHRIKQGLDVPITGAPAQVVEDADPVVRVAVVADDYPGMKPRMHVQQEDVVKRGQLLFEDRNVAGVRFTAPAAGRVMGINRGAKRALRSVVIQLSEAERSGELTEDDHQSFESYTGEPAASLDRDAVRALLVESGLWTAIRQRPFSKVPAPESQAQALFVTAIDTNPLAADPAVVLADRGADFRLGLELLSKLIDGPTRLCIAPRSPLAEHAPAGVQVEEFAGPHPAGTAGLHIHLLAPVSRNRISWWIGYQEVAAVGRLFSTGRLDVSRVVSFAGPPVTRPRLLRTRLGASVEDLAEGEVPAGEELRLIAGSVLSGKKAMGNEFGFLGRYDTQVSVLREGRDRALLGWLAPGKNIFSVIPLFISRMAGGRRFDMTTTTYGSPRAMVPIGLFERVMPLDILPTFLLRSLLVGDVEQAEKLGALELDEEDLALCTFVCPGKTEYGPVLRRNLETLEAEG